jgi:hypothetical protein
VLSNDEAERVRYGLEVVGHNHPIEDKVAEDGDGTPRHGWGGLANGCDSDSPLDIERAPSDRDRPAVPMKMACNAVIRAHCPQSILKGSEQELSHSCAISVRWTQVGQGYDN